MVNRINSWIKNIGSTRQVYINESIENPVDKVLDIGCSYGWALGSLTEKAKELWGIDDESWRVLKDGGLFIFTAPYEGLFAWAEPLDFKYRFPALYQIYMSISKYTSDTPIEVGHKHLSFDEINQLFDDRFQIEEIIYCGLFMPFINWILTIGQRLKLLPFSFRDELNRLQAWESGVQYPQFLAFNIRIKAYKKMR